MSNKKYKPIHTIICFSRHFHHIIIGSCSQIAVKIKRFDFRQSTIELAAERIYDRVLEMCVLVYFSGESLRMAKAAEKLHQFRLLADGK